jgi:DnaJ-class molecular chaperone
MSATNPGRDLYRLLGVEPDASTEQIARAYRRLARGCHPDMTATTGAAEDFARITHAYRVLSDPRARARYDATRTARTRTTDTGEALWLGGPSFSRAFHDGVLLRVLGQGLPNPTGPAGDLCAGVWIVVPARPARKWQ